MLLMYERNIFDVYFVMLVHHREAVDSALFHVTTEGSSRDVLKDKHCNSVHLIAQK